MTQKSLFSFVLLLTIRLISGDKNIFCYYNSRAFYREGQGQFNISDIEPALQYCTHLFYGFAGVHPTTYKLQLLNQQLDIDRKNFDNILTYKRQFPGLKILLSIGGGEDETPTNGRRKYLDLLESTDYRLDFIDSINEFLKQHRFDGIDLGWQFPETKPKRNRGVIGSAYHSLKKKLTGQSSKDLNADNHKEQFTNLVRELKNSLKNSNHLLTLSVLPNVNSSVYLNPRILAPNLDFINLLIFDFYTPKRTPNLADYPSPLFEAIDRRLDENIDRQIHYWLEHGTPKQKLVLGIPTYGRAWKLTATREIPPVEADGLGQSGPFIKEPGLWSYSEICHAFGNPDKRKSLERFRDSSLRYGDYAFRLPKNGEGIWIGYEDPEFVTKKGNYVKSKNLQGLSIVDLTLDDFRGICGVKFPILRAAKQSLQ